MPFFNPTGVRSTILAALTLASATTGAAAGDDADAEAGPPPTIASSLPGGGAPGGHRKRLADQGVSYGFNYVGEVQGNISGGFTRRTVYVGRLEGYADLDFDKLAGLKGLTVHASAYQIHGDGLSATTINNLMPVSYIEAHPTTRLFELWAEQKLFDDKLALRFGQLAADAEFITSSYAIQFINGTFGWPAIHAVNLPSGGSAYPLATPGVRVQLNPTKDLSLLAGVFNGDPAGRCASSDDPQECNRYGTNFRVQDPAFVIGEVQYRYGQEKGAGKLAGTVKVGGWHQFGKLDDLRFDDAGIRLADSANSNGNPLVRRGDSGIYAVIDQQIWRPASGEPDKGIGVFGRVSASPEGGRNVMDLYFDGGIVFAGLVPRRPDDIVSFGAAYGRISRAARDADRDALDFGAAMPIRDYEALLEFNYQAQILPGWTIDADVQHVMHPGGNVANPAREDGAAIKDATVLTVHTQIKY